MVPVMFDETNKLSVKYADAWAQRTDAKIYFLHVLNLSDRYYTEEMDLKFESKVDEVMKRLSEKMENFLKETEVQSTYECLYKVGKPYHKILDLQQSLDIDLIIMCSHAHPKVERQTLGKNTDQVLQQAKCPVYVYKDHTRPFSNKLIVPLENITNHQITDVEKQVIKMADEWALRRESEIYFMHAARLTEPFYIPDIEQIYESKRGTKEAYDNLSNKLTELVSALDIKSPYECIIRDGKVPQQIIDQQQALNAKLIIMSNHGGKGLGEHFLGSTSDYVLHNSKCPIFLYKAA